MFFNETEELIHYTKEMNMVLEDDIFLSIDIVNETHNSKFDFEEDEKNKMFAFINEGKPLKMFDYNHDICLLNDTVFARYEALKEIKNYVDEWFRSYCS